jgi:hypothetical protein
MPINVSEALDSDTGEIITVIRYSSSGFVDGIYVESSPITFKTLASVQQATAQETIMLPEGERNKDIRKFISKKPLYSSNDKDEIPSDTVIYKGKEYKIISPSDWDSYGHTTAFGARDK